MFSVRLCIRPVSFLFLFSLLSFSVDMCVFGLLKWGLYIWAARLFFIQVPVVACRHWGPLSEGRHCALTVTLFFLPPLAPLIFYCFVLFVYTYDTQPSRRTFVSYT